MQRRKTRTPRNPADLDALAAKRTSEIQRLEEELASAKAGWDRALEVYDAKVAELDAAKRENGQLHERVTEGREQNRKLIATQSDLRTRLAEVQGEAATQRRKYQQLLRRNGLSEQAVAPFCGSVVVGLPEQPGQIQWQSSNDVLRAQIQHLEKRLEYLEEEAANPIYVAALDPARGVEANVEKRLEYLEKCEKWAHKQIDHLNAHLEESRSAIPSMDRAIAEIRDRLDPPKGKPPFYWETP